MRRILPEARWVQLDASHRIFDSFFRMEHRLPRCMRNQADVHGIFEDNALRERLMVIANHNHDVRILEFSDQGLWPIDLSNEAYKLGVNYMVADLIH